MSKLGDNIVKYRKKLNLSQEDLALKLGITRQSISKWERNEANPDLYNVQLLASELNVSIDALLGKGAIDDKNKETFIDSFIKSSLKNSRSTGQLKKAKKKILTYGALTLCVAIIIVIIGIFGFLKTGMINVSNPEFLQASLLEGNTYPAISIFKAIAVGLTFFGFITIQKSIRIIKKGVFVDIDEVTPILNEED
jgi:transcriptional regulator with XRE-family HTH domain